MSQFLDPARSIVVELGGATATARLLGVRTSTVYWWMKPKPKGRGGLIPQKYITKILTVAAERKLPILATDFVPLPE